LQQVRDIIRKPSLRPGAWEWLGWGVYTEWIIWNLAITHEGEYTAEDQGHAVAWGMSTAWIFAGANIAGRIGLWPIVTILAAFNLGKYISHALDPESGEDKYLGFISWGLWEGSEEPNYIAGGSDLTRLGQAGSGGYFDIAGNIGAIVWGWKKDNERARLEREGEARKPEVEKERLRQENLRLVRESIRMGSAVTPAELYEYGFIDSEEYLKRLHALRIQWSDDLWARKRQEEAQRKWKALSKSEKKGMLELQRSIKLRSNFW